MRKITFPYILNRPIIPIEIKNAREKIWVICEGYVDSGASFSIFSVKDAKRLGISYQKGKEIYVTVGDGSMIPVFLHVLPVKIGNNSFKATVEISSRLGVGFNLIGRKDFFGRFDITFSDTSKTITFAPIPGKLR